MAEKIKKCPICKKETMQEFRPFCSRQCKNVDLNRWLSGTYVVPGDELINGQYSQEIDTESEET
tara:strand:+ start:66763 stop:66954 length:192 start_codon:yes stop_codon:yes gene_type:complete